MFPLRLVFLLMAAVMFFNSVFGGESNDIIGEIIKLKKRMENVEGTVVRVVEREEKTEKKVDVAMNKIDEKLDLLVGKVIDLNTEMKKKTMRCRSK